VHQVLFIAGEKQTPVSCGWRAFRCDMSVAHNEWHSRVAANVTALTLIAVMCTSKSPTSNMPCSN